MGRITSSSAAFEGDVSDQLQAEGSHPVFVVRRRDHSKGARWRTFGTAPTRREALALVTDAADWWIGKTVLSEPEDEVPDDQ